jgi:hypothetical protein
MKNDGRELIMQKIFPYGYYELYAPCLIDEFRGLARFGLFDDYGCAREAAKEIARKYRLRIVKC